MNPDEFRKIRLEINKLCDEVEILSEKHDADACNKKIDRAGVCVETLTEQAEGEIQERSVKNLKYRIKYATLLTSKIKIKPGKAAGASKISHSTPSIVWDENRLSSLSDNYLMKLLDNMASHEHSNVCFSTTGKGVKPSYQIDFGENQISAYSGSSHKKLKRNLPNGVNKISKPFSLQTIQSIIKGKH